MPPMTVETEPLDVAAATEAVDEAATLRIHDDETSDDVAEVTEAEALDVAADSVMEAATVDYDDAVVGVAVEDSKPLDKTDGDGNQLHEVTVAIATPSPRRNADAESTLSKISEAAEEVRYWREQLALLKDQSKEAKENLQGAINRLMRLSSEVANDATRPLLAAAEKPAEAVSPLTEAQREAAAQGLVEHIAAEAPPPAVEPLPSPSTESWRAYRFDDATHFPTLAAQKAIVAKLWENSPPINTIGDLLDFQKPVGDYSKTLTDIKGIGTGKAEKIENALEEFWASHPDLVQEAVDAS